MLTTFDDEYVTQSLKAGATGYLLKNLPAADLARAVRLPTQASPSSTPPSPPA